MWTRVYEGAKKEDYEGCRPLRSLSDSVMVYPQPMTVEMKGMKEAAKEKNLPDPIPKRLVFPAYEGSPGVRRPSSNSIPLPRTVNLCMASYGRFMQTPERKVQVRWSP
jgi:hypothetical protein